MALERRPKWPVAETAQQFRVVAVHFGGLSANTGRRVRVSSTFSCFVNKLRVVTINDEIQKTYLEPNILPGSPRALIRSPPSAKTEKQNTTGREEGNHCDTCDTINPKDVSACFRVCDYLVIIQKNGRVNPVTGWRVKSRPKVSNDTDSDIVCVSFWRPTNTRRPRWPLHSGGRFGELGKKLFTAQRPYPLVSRSSSQVTLQ
jgi:hypothetical protein